MWAKRDMNKAEASHATEAMLNFFITFNVRYHAAESCGWREVVNSLRPGASSFLPGVVLLPEPLLCGETALHCVAQQKALCMLPLYHRQ